MFFSVLSYCNLKAQLHIPYFFFRNRTGNIASQNPIHADNYHFISADNPPLWSDISGIASRIGYSHWNYFGSVCWNNKIHRVGVTEFFGNPRDWEGGKLGASLVRI